MVIGISEVLLENLVFVLLPKQLVLLSFTFEIFDQITASESQHREERLELLGWDLEVLLKPGQEFVMVPGFLGLRRSMRSGDGSVTEEVRLDS